MISSLHIHRTYKESTYLLIYSTQQSPSIDNTSIERVEEFKYLTTMLSNQNSTQEEIKSRLKLGNA